MRRFINASANAYAELERSAKNAAYVMFYDAELPPGCVPPRARVGVKIDQQSGVTTLLVDRGVRYYGADLFIRRWIEHSEISFPTFGDFRRSISVELARAFSQSATAKNALAAPAVGTPNQATVVDQVAAGMTPGATALVPSATDPVTNKLIGFLVRQIAQNYGIQVDSIEGALFGHIHSKLLAAMDQATCDTVIDDLLGGPFALASVEGHRKVNLQAGPPLTCVPVEDLNNG